jgi:hypothetical protein
VRLRCCETILIGSLLLCSGWLPGDALAEDSTGAETRVVANYRIDLDNFNLGSFRFTTLLNGSDYRVQGNGHFSILGGLLYDLRTTTASSGKVTSAGLEPATYGLSYAAGSDSGQLSISFDAGAVTALSIVPKQTRDPREIPVTKEQLVGALDPIAAAFFRARSDDPNGDLKVCDQTVPVFDGGWRYDLVLSPKRRIALQRKGSTAYSSYAVICRVEEFCQQLQRPFMSRGTERASKPLCSLLPSRHRLWSRAFLLSHSFPSVRLEFTCRQWNCFALRR